MLARPIPPSSPTRPGPAPQRRQRRLAPTNARRYTVPSGTAPGNSLDSSRRHGEPRASVLVGARQGPARRPHSLGEGCSTQCGLCRLQSCRAGPKSPWRRIEIAAKHTLPARPMTGSTCQSLHLPPPPRVPGPGRGARGSTQKVPVPVPAPVEYERQLARPRRRCKPKPPRQPAHARPSAPAQLGGGATLLYDDLVHISHLEDLEPARRTSCLGYPPQVLLVACFQVSFSFSSPSPAFVRRPSTAPHLSPPSPIKERFPSHAGGLPISFVRAGISC